MQNLFPKLFFFTCLIFSNLSLLFSQEGVVLNGQASYYHDKFDGRMTASGEVFDQDGMTCAHKTLDFGTILKITNLENNLSVTVRVNDRGPFVEGRIVDLTKAAAQKIGLYEMGVCNAKVEIISINDQIASLPPPQNNEIIGTTTVILPKEPAPKPVVQNEPVDFKSFTYRISVNKDSISGFTIQLGAFTKIENAFKLAEELHSKGFNETFLYKSVTNGNEYYRILYGDFLSGASAKLFQNQLLEAGYKGILVVP